jgi:hypothetical protein
VLRIPQAAEPIRSFHPVRAAPIHARIQISAAIAVDPTNGAGRMAAPEPLLIGEPETAERHEMKPDIISEGMAPGGIA